MDSGCSCKLGQTTDCIFYFTRGNHHKVSKLVYNNNDLWQFHRFLFCTCCLYLFCFSVIFIQITYTVLCKCIVSICHLLNCPVQCSRSFLRVCHNRNKQMRNAIIYTKLNHLRIYHDKLDFIRFCLIQNTDDQRIDAYRFTGTCGTGDQKMRHLCNICHNCFTRDIFTNCKRKL